MKDSHSSRHFQFRKTRVLRPLATGIAAILFAGAGLEAQTYTSASSTTFTNPLVWNFGAGPVPASDAGLALAFQSYGTGAITAANDLNLTLNRLDLATYGTGAFTLSNASLNGGFAFAGGTGQINLLGSGAAATVSAGVVLGQGLTSLTVAGSGASGVFVSGVLSSNTSAGVQVVIAPGSGGVSLSAANTFAGSVVLNSGTLTLTNAAALGARANPLVINGGSLRGNVTVANNVTLNGTLNYIGTPSLNPTLLTGMLSGAGGVTNSATGSTTSLALTGINSYLGATIARGSDLAASMAADGAGIITINGAAGSIMNTSGISVSEGGEFRVNYNLGNSLANTRVSPATAITANSGFVEVIGNAGVVRQNLGALSAGGLTTLFSSTNAGGGTVTAGAATEVTIANLVRPAGASVIFTGPNLGSAAVAPGLAAAQGNVLLTQINGAAPSTALIGGGGAVDTADISILPWALGDTVNFVGTTGVGSGFVTYGANGVRLLNAGTEYNTSNNFTTGGIATNNMRIGAGAVTDPVAPTTVNSIFFGTTGQAIGGASALTITSGALASNVAAASITAPVNFGAGGLGEGVVSVVGTMGTVTPNALTLGGTITAGSLVKSGHGTLTLSGSGNAIGAITVDGGQLSIDAVSRLGGATALTFNGHSDAANRTGVTFTAAATDTLAAPVTTNSGMAGFTISSTSGMLNLNSNVSGAGGIRKDGDGTLVLGGINSYSGGTYLGAGTLSIDSDARLGSGFLGLTGGTLLLTGNWNTARPINVGVGASLNTQANSATLSGPISGGGNLLKLGAGTLTIAGADNAFTGLLQLGDSTSAGGTLMLSGAGALNSASVQFGQGAASAIGNYVLDLSGVTAPSGTPWRSLVSLSTATSFPEAHEVKLGANVGAPVDLRVAAGTFGGTAGIISGFGKLVKVGTDTFTLTGSTAGTFTGAVEIWGGTLAFGADNQLGAGANAITIKGGILNNTSPVASGRGITLGATPVPIISASAAVTLANGINTGAALTLNGAIVGAGGFNKTGAGTTLTLGSASNSFSGDLQITAGTVAFTDPATLGAASSRIRLNGGTLQDAVGSGTQTVSRTLITTANSTVDVAAGATLDLSGPIFGINQVTKTGAGVLSISGNASSYFGTLSLSSTATGNVTLASAGQLRRATISIAANSAAAFDMSGLARELGDLSLGTGTTLALGAGGQLTFGFNGTSNTWSGNITGNGAASVIRVGAFGVTILSDANTFGGGVHLLSGLGQNIIQSAAAGGPHGALPLQSAFTLGAWGSPANAGPRLTLSNSVANADRLADTQVIHSNAGVIVFTTNSTASNETIGSLRGSGMTTVTMTTGGTLNFGDVTNGLVRINGGTFLFRSGGSFILGSGGASNSRANITVGNSASLGLIGGGGADGTTTISILPYAVGGLDATDTGSNFVTYGANGVRLLFGSELSTQTNVAAIAGGASSNNVRFTNSALTTTQITGGTDLTVNSLGIAGTASTTRIQSATTEKLIVTSGALLNTVANVHAPGTGTTGVPLGIQTAELQTGAGNTRELNVFTSADLAIGAKITTTGGLTKSGASALYLTNNGNTYTGATTINAGNLAIDSLAALGGSTTLQMGGGFLKYRGANATLTQAVVAAGGEAANPNGGSAGFHVVSGTTLTVGNISGYGSILKDGTGVLKLMGTNSYSGVTIINGGALAIDNPAALGTNSRVVFGDGTILTGGNFNGGQTLRFDAPMTLSHDFIVNASSFAPLAGFGFDTNGNDVTLSGTLLDARSASPTRGLYKFGAGELNLTATEMYTGPTQIFGGTLRLSGANGSVVNSTGAGGFNTGATVLINPGAALVLDNAAANNHNRLPDVWDTPFGTGNAPSGTLLLNGGELKLVGHASGTAERINQLDVTVGTITLQNGGATVTSGKFNRTLTYSAGLIRGDNLGSLPSATSTNWFVTDLGSGGVQLGGAGGAEGTPFINILAGFMGDTSSAGKGADFLTYAADTGFRTLTAGEYTSTIPANNFDLNRAPNVALTGAATVNQTTAITALKLGAGASIGGAGTLLLAQGTVLATGNASVDLPSLSTSVTGSNGGYAILTPAAATVLTVNSILPGAGLTKYGEGTLVFNGRYLGNGGIAVAQGTLQLGAATAALHPDQPITVRRGATLDLGGSDRIIAGLHTSSLVGASNMGQASDGIVALGANRLTLDPYGDSYVFTGDITGTGGVTSSSSSQTFTQPLSYTGSTIISAGTFRLAGGGTLASSAVKVLRGNLEFINTDDNAAAGGYIANRIGTTIPVTLGGGAISFTDNTHTPGNHSLGPVTLLGGGDLLNVGNLLVFNGGSAPSTVTIANLSRSAAHGTLTVRASNLGLAPSPNGNVRIFLTQIEGAAPASALVGGGGAVGSTTQGILPWAWWTFNPLTEASLLTYGAEGLRPLAASEYEVTTINGATSTDSNLSTTTALQVLDAPRTVNSLYLNSASVSGAFDLTLQSGALLTRTATTIGVNTNSLLTGAGNTRELVVIFRSPSSGTLTLNYNLSTSGGVTVLAPAAHTIALRGANTFTGGLTLSGGAKVDFTADNQLGAAGGVVRLGGRLQYSGSPTLVFNRPVELTGEGGFASTATQRWQLNAPITGEGNVEYFGGIFEFNAANTHTGTTRLWSTGPYFINGDSAFGNGGHLELFTSGFIVLRGDWTTSRPIVVVGTLSVQTDGHEATLSGLLTGSSAVAKSGNGSLIITEAMPFGSGTSQTISVNAGELRLANRGAIETINSTVSIGSGASLSLDDTGAHSSDRLNDNSGAVTLTGGSLNLLGNSTVTTEEVINNLTLNASSASAVTVSAGSGQSAILRVAGTATVNAGASLFRGTNLGVNAPGSANTASILINSGSITTGLVGGGAPAGHPAISILRGAFGDTSATGLGTQLVTYDVEKGVRLLDPATEFTTTLTNGSVVNDNVKADASILALANTTTANALWLKDGASVTGAGLLTLTAGNLLVTGTGNTIANPITAGSNAFAVGGPGDVTLGGAVSGTGGLIKQGAGTLTLSVANSYTGSTVLAAGAVAVANASAFASTALQLQGGEIRNTSGGLLTLSNNLTLNGTMNVGGAQDLIFGGAVSLANATRAVNVTNTGTTTFSGVISSSQTLINYGLTKTGPGLLVIANAANTYDGETTVAGGELRITGSISASTLTTVTSGTLSGTGTVGPLKTTGGTLAPGTSVGILNAGNTDFSGGIFSIEIASAASADKLNITGTAGLSADTALSLSLLGGYDPAPGDAWTIIENDGADAFFFGSFRFTNAGNPIEPNTPFMVGGETFYLSYTAGSGNDLILYVPEPGATALLAAALPLLALRRRRRSRGRLPS